MAREKVCLSYVKVKVLSRFVLLKLRWLALGKE